MQHMICAERMRLTVHVQPGGEKTVPADPFNVEAETVPDRRIQQMNMELRGLQNASNASNAPHAPKRKSGLSHMTCDRPLHVSPDRRAFAGARRGHCSRVACSFLRTLVDLSALFHELDRLRFHALLQRLDVRYPLLRRIFTNVLGDLHRTEVRAAHRAEMRDFG
jgi:hypothetical protein